MTQLSVSIVAISLLLSVIACGLSVFALRRAETKRLIQAERAAADARMELELLRNSYDSVREAVKRINSRYAMREHRAKKKNGSDGFPDPNTDPEGWRTAVQREFPRGVFSMNGAG